MKNLLVFSGLLALFFILSCNRAEISDPTDQGVPDLPESPYAYDHLDIPAEAFSANIFTDLSVTDPSGNIALNKRMEITPWAATLGRVLFYDKKLSLNNTVACASCHHQDKAFADGLRVSPGFEGRLTTRNSMAIVNPIVLNNLFWDSRSRSIHDLSLRPVQNHIEMGMEDLQRLEVKLSSYSYYKPLFEKAFGDSRITSERISKAISQFVASITSTRSRFDEVRKTGNTHTLTNLEKMGMDLFFSDRTKCSTCHSGFNFSAPDGPFDAYGGGAFGSGRDLGGATNIGLDLVYEDNGMGNGRFKIPSLRNIELTAPYMHDGRFKTLEEVIDHYSHGIKPHQHLDPKFKDSKGHVVHPKYNNLEKQALIAFLKTLTDKQMTTDPKYSDPFRK